MQSSVLPSEMSATTNGSFPINLPRFPPTSLNLWFQSNASTNGSIDTSSETAMAPSITSNSLSASSATCLNGRSTSSDISRDSAASTDNSIPVSPSPKKRSSLRLNGPSVVERRHAVVKHTRPSTVLELGQGDCNRGKTSLPSLAETEALSIDEARRHQEINLSSRITCMDVKMDELSEKFTGLRDGNNQILSNLEDSFRLLRHAQSLLTAQKPKVCEQAIQFDINNQPNELGKHLSRPDSAGDGRSSISEAHSDSLASSDPSSSLRFEQRGSRDFSFPRLPTSQSAHDTLAMSRELYDGHPEELDIAESIGGVGAFQRLNSAVNKSTRRLGQSLTALLNRNTFRTSITNGSSRAQFRRSTRSQERLNRRIEFSELPQVG